ncbi:MAG: hypothetical protein IVW55_16030 [Chloroflexi bacterium]|nr:hypothetical protein [Chloroflexota bacterium]
MSQPFGLNILTESDYLHQNANFETQLISGGMVDMLAHAHYRALVDFWLVGYEGPHTGKHQEIIDSYWSSINTGNDSGVPFNNGQTYYVHPYPSENKAWTQEFITQPDTGVPGSILNPTAGGIAHYVRGSIWATYAQKNGPNSNGPGLPYNSSLGDEHSFALQRGQRGNIFNYTAQNFERGAVTSNAYEGAISLPNCQVHDLDPSHWAYYYTRDMVNRFALSNDLSADQSVEPRTYPDAGVHATDEYTATRAQLVQAIMLAEGYSYPPSGYHINFAGMQTHWGTPWV